MAFDSAYRIAWRSGVSVRKVTPPSRAGLEIGLRAYRRCTQPRRLGRGFSVRIAKSEAAPKVYAADIEPSMVRYLRERAAKEGLNNVTAVQAAADQPNLPEPVDLILIVDTYHHIGDRETYFRKLAKSIRPGGRVAIIDFKPDSPEGPPKEFRFPLEKFKSEMGKAGYKLAAQHNFLPRQQFLMFEVAGPSSR